MAGSAVVNTLQSTTEAFVADGARLNTGASGESAAQAVQGRDLVGDEVQPEHYGPVAAAIRFADALRRRRAARGF